MGRRRLRNRKAQTVRNYFVQPPFRLRELRIRKRKELTQDQAISVKNGFRDSREGKEVS